MWTDEQWKIFKQKESLLIQSIHIHTKIKIGSVCSVEVSKDNSYIISGFWDKTIRIWNLKTNMQEGILCGHNGHINILVFSPDYSYIISGSYDNTIRIWSLKQKTELAIFRSHANYIISIAITSSNDLVVSASMDMTIRVWSLTPCIRKL